jgi:hypothetical protein
MRVWVLNLDAEFELASAGPYQIRQALARTLQPFIERARVLLAPEDTLLDDAAPLPPSTTAQGACWCPTPSALRRLSRAGVTLPPSPSLSVLQQVNQRSFYLGLGGGAPGASYFDDEASLSAALTARGSAPWLFKRRFGFAGRGQRRLGRELSADDRRWLADSLRQGGLLGEPWLEIEREVCLHGMVEPGGRFRLGQPCWQHTDAQRAWLGSTRVRPGELTAEAERALLRSAEHAAGALSDAGYFGPFGVDAYFWRTTSGTPRFNPLGELNARYTMGFSVGMSPARELTAPDGTAPDGTARNVT